MGAFADLMILNIRTYVVLTECCSCVIGNRKAKIILSSKWKSNKRYTGVNKKLRNSANIQSVCVASGAIISGCKTNSVCKTKFL